MNMLNCLITIEDHTEKHYSVDNRSLMVKRRRSLHFHPKKDEQIYSYDHLQRIFFIRKFSAFYIIDKISSENSIRHLLIKLPQVSLT